MSINALGGNVLSVSGSNVGIGTSNPTSTLSVVGAVDNLVSVQRNLSYLQNARVEADIGSSTRFVGNFSGVYKYTIGTVFTGSANGGDFEIRAIPTNSNSYLVDGEPLSRLRIRAVDGNVGIGTTTFNHKVNIANTPTLQLQGIFTNCNYTTHGRIYFNDNNFGIGAGRFVDNDTTSDHLYFWSYGAAGRDIVFCQTGDGLQNPQTFTKTMVIRGGTGNVGIGTSNPGTRLHVNGGVIVQGNNTLEFGWGLTKEGNAGKIGYQTFTDGLDIVGAGTAPPRKVNIYDNLVVQGSIGTVTNSFTAGSNVGLGVANPLVQLHLSTDGARKLSTTTWSTGSDARVKMEIEDASTTMCYDIVKQLKLKRFAWNPLYYPEVDDRHSLGWIAQDVRPIFPNAVKVSKEHGFEDFHTLNVDQINKVLYGAVQQLILDKEQLEVTVASLKQRLDQAGL